jgi:hypothetical protein
MNVILHQREREDINPKLGGLHFDLVFDPEFSMIEVLSGNGIITEEKTSSTYTSNNV